MTSATLNIKVSPRRMLSEREAADYCGLPFKAFRVGCPVTSIQMPGGRRAFDMRDLDDWLDNLKGGITSGDDVYTTGGPKRNGSTEIVSVPAFLYTGSTSELEWSGCIVQFLRRTSVFP